LNAIQDWEKSPENELLQAKLIHKYWTRSIYFSQKKVKIPKGAISPYDHFSKNMRRKLTGIGDF